MKTIPVKKERGILARIGEIVKRLLHLTRAKHLRFDYKVGPVTNKQGNQKHVGNRSNK
jgi:hypothetical protein